MQRLIPLFLVFLFACEGPVGPEGPAGAAGPEGPAGPEGAAAEVIIRTAFGVLDERGRAANSFSNFWIDEGVLQCWQRSNSQDVWYLITSDAILIDTDTGEEIFLVTSCVAEETSSGMAVAVKGFPGWEYLIVAISGR